MPALSDAGSDCCVVGSGGTCVSVSCSATEDCCIARRKSSSSQAAMSSAEIVTTIVSPPLQSCGTNTGTILPWKGMVNCIPARRPRGTFTSTSTGLWGAGCCEEDAPAAASSRKPCASAALFCAFSLSASALRIRSAALALCSCSLASSRFAIRRARSVICNSTCACLALISACLASISARVTWPPCPARSYIAACAASVGSS
mmetsp:Transcript_2526/g.5227  ORF Transcript_2526/g.5227 Transcript_2526/m.5227 type:complete len:203 (+) Transcript_2526:1062-1670(+)